MPLLGFILPQQQPNRRNFSNVATHLARRATRKGIFCRIIFCTQGQGIKNAAARPQRRALWCLASRRDDCAAHCAAVSSGLARAGGLGNGVGARTLLRQGQACKAGLRQPRQLRHGECFFIAPESFLDSSCDRRVTADRGRAYAGLRTRLPAALQGRTRATAEVSRAALRPSLNRLGRFRLGMQSMRFWGTAQAPGVRRDQRV